MSECDKYGMIDGCNEYCPVYKRGECDNEDAIYMLHIKNKQVYIPSIEESHIVQKKAIELGWKWPISDTTIKDVFNTYILFQCDMSLSISMAGNSFYQKIDIDFFTKNILKSNIDYSNIIENSIKTLKDKLKRI